MATRTGGLAAGAGQGAPKPAAADERPRIGGRPLAMDDLVAWCIVPFDSRKRTPEERIAMLERLGLRMLQAVLDSGFTGPFGVAP